MTVGHPPGPGNAPPAAVLIDGVDVEAVAMAVVECPGVSGLDHGRYGEVASYLPGRQVPGVVVTGDAVLVQVRSRWGVPAAELLRQVTAMVSPLAGRRRIDLVIGDIDDPVPGPWPPAVAAPGALVPGPTGSGTSGAHGVTATRPTATGGERTR
jgi:hypothetical protein